MICQNCYKTIPDKEKICPACRMRQSYVLGAITAEKVDLFRLAFAEENGRGYDVSAEKAALTEQRQNGWCCPFGSDSGLYSLRRAWKNDFRAQEFHIDRVGGALIGGRNVYLPTKSDFMRDGNGICVLARDRFNNFFREDIPLEDTPLPGAVLFGNFIILPVRRAGDDGYCFSVICITEPRKFLGYLSDSSGAILRVVGKFPRLIVDAEHCLLFIAGEDRMRGFVFTGSRFFVPFKPEKNLDLEYLNGSGKLSDVAYANGKFFFVLFCPRDEKYRWKIAAAEIVGDENGKFRLSPRTFPLYVGASVLRVFVHDDILHWLSLKEGALLLFTCGTNFSDTGGVPKYTIKTLLASSRVVNVVDLIEFDGISLTLYGHNSADDRYVRCIRARLEDEEIHPVPGEDSIREETISYPDRPFFLERIGTERMAFPRTCSSKNITVFIDGDTIIKLR